jgi:hypothetical protein
MRWPFRRKAVEETAAADRPQETVASTVDAMPVTRAWATLPVIAVTIPSAAPLVVGPAPVVPPLRLADRGGADAVEPAIGTVTGIARPAVRAAEPEAPAAAPAAPALTVRRAAVAAPADVVPLVDAVDEYVGAPREPAQPHRAPGWLRFTPEWAKQASAVPDLPMAPAPAAAPELVIAEPPSFLPEELRNPPKADPPPRVVEDVPPAAEPAGTPMRKRRASLGQSRRLGLGAPIAKPDLVHPEESPPTVEGTVDTPQEPPPPPAAPARVADPEPEPVEPARPVSLAEALQRTAELIHPPADPAPDAEQAPPAAEIPRATVAEPVRSADVPVRPVAATYRATAEPPRPAHRRERPRATVVDRVPPSLAGEVRTRQRADVSDVPVYRGPQVDAAAKARGARAFAAGGAVFLPDDAGPVDSPATRGLLAHELVHAVQQRTLGPHLPGPGSAVGQQLEAEAQAAERFYAGEAGAAEPPELIHAPLPAPAPVAEPEVSGTAQLSTAPPAPLPTPASAPAPSPLNSPFDPVTTAEVDKIATESARHVVSEWTNPRLQQQQQGQHGQHGQAGSHGDTPQSTTHSGTGKKSGKEKPFDPMARRDQLVAAALLGHNRHRAPGGTQQTELSNDELRAIDHKVDLESARHGVAYQKPYLANTAESWMHAITGTNTHYGSGIGGYGASIGTSASWFESETRDERPLKQRLADQMGLINADTAKQFNTSSWWQPPEEEEAAQDSEQGNQDSSGLNLDTAQLDELAARLYDRLRSRLRTELLVDRERAGLLTDFR